MEIVSVCVISTVFGVVQLVMMVVIVLLHPATSSASYTLGVNECFERVAIGKRLNGSDVSRSIRNTTLKQCDVECEREMCNAYAYGIGPNGNGTCEMSVPLPKTPPNEDPDYDLFIRVLQCRNMTMCFKRLVPGRRIIDRYVRRTFPCDSLARCQLACSIEREFICEGFNYRFGTSLEVGNSCQLSAMPGMNLDLTLDFTSDVDYDFYTRDRNAPAACGHLSYKTWNYGYAPKTHVGAGEWWQKPSAVPPDYDVNLQPRVDVNDIYKNRWNSHGYECFVRARTGYRLHRQVVVMTLNAPTLYDCEFVCANERKFMCNILSYRYSSVPSTDNCMLGEKTIRQLDFYFDLVPERDYDVYVRNEFSKPGCQPTRTWDSDCFERIRTGLRLDPTMVRFSVNTDTLIDCELICLHIRHFTCRAFSFRYGPNSATGGYNCLLTDRPVPEMDPRRHFLEDSSCELYHRGSYGHGCEIDRWPYTSNPASYPDFTPNSRKDWSPPSASPSPTPSPPPPLKPTVFTVTTTVYSYDPYDSRRGGPTTPMSPFDPGFDYRNGLFPPVTGKPYLPPDPSHSPGPKFRPQRPVLPASPTLPPEEKPHVFWFGSGGGDRKGIGGTGGGGGYDTPHRTRKMDKICYIAYGSPARLKAAAVGTSVLVVNEQECKAECSRARDGSKFRCSTISYWSGHCELSDIELRDLKPGYDFVQHDTYWLFSWDFTNPRCYTPLVTPPTDGVWSTYTVSGRRCKWGTQCSHRSDAGIWSCPVDDGDWDYCCRPDHHCGYSEGYNYSWCYVGSVSREQWRPCSDVYYPYKEHDRGAPHWPISYVHRQGPPNNTAQYRQDPSVVDSFLESLRFNKERLVNNFTRAVGNSYPASSSFSHGNSSVLEFQVVDVTENSKINSNNSTPRNWIQTKSSNMTAVNNHYNSVKIIQPNESEKIKRSPNSRSPNIT